MVVILSWGDDSCINDVKLWQQLRQALPGEMTTLNAAERTPIFAVSKSRLIQLLTQNKT